MTGDTFRTAASAANARLKLGPVPMVLADVAVPGTSPWVEKVVRSCPVVFVSVDLGEGQRAVGGNTSTVKRLAPPVTVDEILSCVGLPPLGGGSVLRGDGSVVGGTPEEDHDDLEAFGVDEFDSLPAPMPLPLPAMPMAMPPVEVTEPDHEPPAPTPAPVAVAVAVPAPVPPSQPAVADFWASAPSLPIAPIPHPPVPAAPPVDLWQPEPAPQPVITAPPAVVPVDVRPFDLPTPPTVADTSVEPAAQVVDPPAPEPPAAAPAPAWHQQVIAVEPPAPAPAPAAVVVEQIGVESSYSPTLGRQLAPVIFTLAGKGGVGKTSIALALAQRAAVVGGLRTVLVDGNRGQGDLRTYLSLNRSGLPTIYDAATTGDPSAPIVTPDRLNANRPAGAEELEIALVQAPPRGMADPTTITAALYHDVITAARGMADLVVIDTQIVEGAERGMFDDLIIPMLASNAYGVGIADLSRPGVDNLMAHLAEFTTQGVPVERLMTMLNRVPATTAFDLQKTSAALSRYGLFLGAVPADPEVHSAMAYGTSIQDNPSLAPVLDQILMRVTANPVFAQTQHAALEPGGVSAPRRRGGLFRRGRG